MMVENQNLTNPPAEEQPGEAASQEAEEAQEQQQAQEQQVIQIVKPIQMILKQVFGIDDVDAKIHVTPDPTARGIRTEICVDIEGVVYSGEYQYREYLPDVPIVVYAISKGYTFRVMEAKTDIFGRACASITPTWVGATLFVAYIPVDENLWIVAGSTLVDVMEFDVYIRKLAEAYKRLEEGYKETRRPGEAASRAAPERVGDIAYQVKLMRAAVEAEQRRIRLGASVETPYGRGWVLALDLNRRLVIVIINGQKYEVPLDQVKPVEGT